MKRETYILEIDAVIVDGARVNGMQATEFRELLQTAIARDLQTAALPAGRAVRAEVSVRSGGLAAGGAAVATVVSQAVARAVGGRAS